MVAIPIILCALASASLGSVASPMTTPAQVTVATVIRPIFLPNNHDYVKKLTLISALRV